MIFHGFSLFCDCRVHISLSNVSNPELYWRKLDLLMLLSDLGPKLMATCNNSEDDVVFFFLLLFELNVTVCAAVFKPVCSRESGPGWRRWAGLISRDATLQCKDVFSFLTWGAPSICICVLIFVQYPAVFCEPVGQVQTAAPPRWLVCDAAVILHHSPSKVSDTGYCKLYMLFFFLFAVFFIGDFIKVIFHCLSLERLSILSSIRSDKSDKSGFGSRLQERKNKILKYKCSLNPFLHLFISFSSQVSLNVNIWNHLDQRMNPNGREHHLSNQTVTSTVSQHKEFQGFVKNVYTVTFSCPLEEVFNALGSFYWL